MPTRKMRSVRQDVAHVQKLEDPIHDGPRPPLDDAERERSGFFEAPFDQWEFELNNRGSETHRRGSDFLLIMLSSTRLVLERI